MSSEGAPIILPYKGVMPVFAGPAAHIGPGAAVLGRAELGRGAWLGARSVIRADGHYVRIGDDFRLGPRGTVHIAHQFLPTHVGSNVTAGAGAVIHACDVGDECHIGDRAVILDGSKVEAGCAIAPGSVVFPRGALESGWLHGGAPAQPVRRLAPGELDKLQAEARRQPDMPAEPDRWRADISSRGEVFVAASARLRGKIVFAGENGVWYGCDLDAGVHVIEVGRNTNIQDNSVIRAIAGPVLIGPDCTIGHNVTMSDCRVGRASLIGIGATVTPGTIVEDDVLLAAGARTEEGQVLESGWLYGGSPARQLAPLGDRRRAMIQATSVHYRDYANSFRAEQKRSLVS
ncbi:MAG: gamma carbonic anhydrase family protein [Rhizobiaceae bacterium]